MALQTPLIWDDVRGVSRQLDPAEGLRTLGGLGVNGPLSFWGFSTPVTAQPLIGGDWGQSLQDLFNAAVAYGLVSDSRPSGWSNGLNQVVSLGKLGGLETGRLIIGSVTGWMNLDQPAIEPGVIQAVVAHAGPAETRPGATTTVQQLAYSPVLSFGVNPPNGRPQIAALWFDTRVSRLKIWTGTAWQSTDPANLDALLLALQAQPAHQLLVSNGSGGMKVLLPPPAGFAGMVPMLDGNGALGYVQLLSIGQAAPWADGTSIYGTPPAGGGRQAGAQQALWFNNTANNESLNAWDERAQQWKGIPLANPLLTQLAALRSRIAEGDVLVYRSGQLDRLAIGVTGQNLTVQGGQPSWHSGFTVAGAPPSAALDGDLWLDSNTDALLLRRGGSWRDLNEMPRHQAANGSGGATVAGTAVVNSGSSWRRADHTTARDAAVAIALTDSAAAAPISAAVGGIVSLTAAQWSAVIDSAEAHAPGTGLMAGRMYFVSDLTAGMLTSRPTVGRELPVGMALSSTRLMLRPAPPLSDQPAAADLSPAASPLPQPGALWWDATNQTLKVYVPPTGPGGGGSWQPAAPAPAGGGTPPGTGTPTTVNPLVGVEVIDWVADPLTAAIRLSLSDGSAETIRLRGAGGARVTMADNRTLVIDGGGSAAASTGVIDGGRFSP